jgi:ABC-type bacteriocin/lantibiotic exporter with double-glycine peptidase domain
VRERTKASLLWGVIAALAFLVLVQGYNLLASERVSIGVMIGVAILVGVVASVLSQIAETW